MGSVSWELTFKADVVRDMKGRVIPCDSVLCIAASWCSNLVKCCNTISWLEFFDI